MTECSCKASSDASNCSSYDELPGYDSHSYFSSTQCSHKVNPLSRTNSTMHNAYLNKCTAFTLNLAVRLFSSVSSAQLAEICLVNCGSLVNLWLAVDIVEWKIALHVGVAEHIGVLLWLEETERSVSTKLKLGAWGTHEGQPVAEDNLLAVFW